MEKEDYYEFLKWIDKESKIYEKKKDDCKDEKEWNFYLGYLTGLGECNSKLRDMVD